MQGEWFASMVTGWSTRFSNEHDTETLEREFGYAAFGDPSMIAQCYLALNFTALIDHMDDIQKGVKAAYEKALRLGDDDK